MNEFKDLLTSSLPALKDWQVSAMYYYGSKELWRDEMVKRGLLKGFYVV